MPNSRLDSERGQQSSYDAVLFFLCFASTPRPVNLTLGGVLEAIQTSPDFRRVLLRRGAEAIVIDLVREYAAQAVMEKPVINGIRVDPPQEILANKLCALLSRSEIRDLVDVRALELAGYAMEDALDAAAAKDRGLTPAQLVGCSARSNWVMT